MARQTAPLVADRIGADPVALTVGGAAVAAHAVADVRITRGRTQVDQRTRPATLSATFDSAQLGDLPVVGDLVTVDLTVAARAYFGLADQAANYVQNPAFAVNTDWWVVLAGSSLTRDLSVGGPIPGVTTAARLTRTGAAAEAFVIDQYPTSHPVTAGRRYALSAYWRAATTPRACRVYINFYNAGGGLTGQVVTELPDSVGGWTRITTTGTAPAGTTQAFCFLSVVGLPTGESHYLSAVQFEEGDRATPWTAAATRPHGAGRRFIGKVTDAAAVSTAPGNPDRVTITAAGTRARLAQIDVGDTPWPAELDGARAGRILAAALLVDPSLATTADAGLVTVMARDVDRQKAGQLLDQLAVSSGGELAELRDGTLAWQDAGHRRALSPTVTLTPDDVIAPVGWEQQLGGLLNDLTIGYGPNPQGTVRVVDTIAAATWPAPQSLGSELPDAAAAQARANDLVGRFARPRWRLPGLAIDLLRTTTAARAGALLALDFGQLLTLAGFPTSGPFAAGDLFVEGATEQLTRSAWRLSLAVSDYRATGPATRWIDVDPGISWAEVPADLSWLGAVAWLMS